MATQTTNYGLTKDADNEYYDVTKINANLDKIDTQIKATDDKAESKISHSLATAVNDFLVASAAGQFVKKTLAEVKTILGLGSAAYQNTSAFATSAQGVKADGAIQSSSLGQAGGPAKQNDLEAHKVDIADKADETKGATLIGLKPIVGLTGDNVRGAIQSLFNNVQNILSENDKDNSINIILDGDNASFTGTKKADALTQNGQCIYKNTLTTAAVELTQITFNNLRFGNYGLVIRIRSANNTLTTDAIKLDVQKNVSGTFTSIASKLIKANDFPNTTDYKCFYINFEYKGVKATNNQLKFICTLQTQTSAYEVALDYIMISPVDIGVFNFN